MISGNGWDGVQLAGSGTIENRSSATGSAPRHPAARLGNWNGVQLNGGAAYSFVYPNLISGNASDGVFLGDRHLLQRRPEQHHRHRTSSATPWATGSYGIILVSGTWGNTVYANTSMYSGAYGLATFGAGGGNSYNYNTVVSNYGGNILWD